MRRSCFSISGSHQHGPPLLGRVRTPPRSPTSALLCSPPTPSPPSAAAPVVPRQRPTPARRACSSPSHRRLRLPVQRRRHFYPGSPLAGSVPRRDKGLPGAWAILFVRAVLFDPAGCDAPLAPLTVRSPSPSGPPRPSAPGMHSISGLSCPRPTRSRAYASPKPLPSPAQGSLPAGRAHPWPGGFRTRWMTNKVSWCHRIRQSSSTSLAWSHRRRESTRAEAAGELPYRRGAESIEFRSKSSRKPVNRSRMRRCAGEPGSYRISDATAAAIAAASTRSRSSSGGA